MTNEQMQEDISELLTRIDSVIAESCPAWLTPNSHFVSLVPGHNLDLLQVAFDFRVDRTSFLLSETPDFLKDPMKADLGVVK